MLTVIRGGKEALHDLELKFILRNTPIDEYVKRDCELKICYKDTLKKKLGIPRWSYVFISNLEEYLDSSDVFFAQAIFKFEKNE